MIHTGQCYGTKIGAASQLVASKFPSIQTEAPSIHPCLWGSQNHHSCEVQRRELRDWSLQSGGAPNESQFASKSKNNFQPTHPLTGMLNNRL